MVNDIFHKTKPKQVGLFHWLYLKLNHYLSPETICSWLAIATAGMFNYWHNHHPTTITGWLQIITIFGAAVQTTISLIIKLGKFRQWLKKRKSIKK